MAGQEVPRGAGLPGIGEILTGFFRSGDEEEAPDEITRQLLLVALAWQSRCQVCMEKQVRTALEAGATQDQVAEVLLMTLFLSEQVHDEHCSG